MNDPDIPILSRDNEIRIFVSKKLSIIKRYKMELTRIDEYAKELCPTDNMGGQIDLEKFIALGALDKCKITMHADEYLFRPFLIPFGFIQITMEIETKDNFKFVIFRYIRVLDNEDPDNTMFYPETHPSADEFSWAMQHDLIINTSASYFPYTHASFGQDNINKRLMGHRISCTGNKPLCSLINTEPGPNLRMSSAELVRQVDLEENPIELTLTFHWAFKFYTAGKTYRNHIVKKLRVVETGLIMDIK
ncbi:hypothetical protein EGW08_019106 [Elysia chlorotica]|uniref:Uncharacterized protein n=1 Tax=Elysia chlorotica TaxID=188477 RepID=A0A433SV45_ELYCH|nr:hypothetical protein EGW08_019106 [Elysia chlorotica]